MGKAAHRAALRRAHQQHASWRPGKAGLLVALMVMVLLGELLVFLDIGGWMRSSSSSSSSS
jgi:hypothetical protein